jgi:hypothetical protein
MVTTPSAQAVLDQLAAYGTPDQVRDEVESWDKSADIVTIRLPIGLPWWHIEATLRAAAPRGVSPARAERLSLRYSVLLTSSASHTR